MTLLAGTRLGPYEILGLLGAGGMGEVYRARDPRLGREVALKVLPADHAANPERLRRFEDEARAVAALSHPHILAIHDVGRAEGLSYVVFEFLEGQTLRQKLEHGALSSRKAVEYGVQICRGLAAAHTRGIVHRDLKPENLFLTREGEVKILDFGLAKLAESPFGEAEPDDAPTRTAPGLVMGTLGYMSPEQARGAEADTRSDLFAVGAILYEMLTGKRAFAGETTADTLSAILHRDPPEIVSAEGPISPGLERVVRRCLEKDPEERFQSARDLAFALEALSGTSGVGVAAPEPQPRRARWVKAGAAVASAAALAGLGLLAGRARWQRPLPTITQLTYEHGMMGEARFAPDGRTVVYSALWDGKPSEVFQLRLEDLEPRPLGLVNARLLSVSSTAELAILQGRPGDSGGMGVGTLARVPLSGGVARPVLENVVSADWSPDGRELAVIRRDAWYQPARLEYPIGTVLVPALPQADLGFSVRVSPRGDRVAVAVGGVLLVDRSGKQRRVISPPIVQGLAWNPDGNALWVTGGESPWARGLWRLPLDGKPREVYRVPGTLFLHDVAGDGRMLVHHGYERQTARAKPPGESQEREIAISGVGRPIDLSADGTQVLTQEGTRSFSGYLRPTKGGPGTRLVTDFARLHGLSPDGRWVLVSPRSKPNGLTLVPTGPGEPREIPTERFESLFSTHFLDEARIGTYTAERGRAPRIWIRDLAGGDWRAVTPEGVAAQWVRLAQEELIGLDPSTGTYAGYSLTGGPPRAVPWVTPADLISTGVVSADGRFGFLYRSAVPCVVERIDLDTGERRPWRMLQPEDRTGVAVVGALILRPDVDAYAYTYVRVLQHLSLIDGAR
jgi:eukaryotic-like serine/threonine-protein kinase